VLRRWSSPGRPSAHRRLVHARSRASRGSRRCADASPAILPSVPPRGGLGPDRAARSRRSHTRRRESRHSPQSGPTGPGTPPARARRPAAERSTPHCRRGHRSAATSELPESPKPSNTCANRSGIHRPKRRLSTGRPCCLDWVSLGARADRHGHRGHGSEGSERRGRSSDEPGPEPVGASNRQAATRPGIGGPSQRRLDSVRCLRPELLCVGSPRSCAGQYLTGLPGRISRGWQQLSRRTGHRSAAHGRQAGLCRGVEPACYAA